MPPVSRTVISRPFRANPLTQCFPGLKPLAESYSPFGATNRAKIFLNLVPFWTERVFGIDRCRIEHDNEDEERARLGASNTRQSAQYSMEELLCRSSSELLKFGIRLIVSPFPGLDLWAWLKR